HAVAGGANISLHLDTARQVKFYYDHKSHWITDSVSSVIATVPGSFQSKLGCTGDWDPGCLRSWLQDPDGDGIYSFTATIAGGNYEGLAVSTMRLKRKPQAANSVAYLARVRS